MTMEAPIMSSLDHQPFPHSWMAEIKSMMEDLIDEKIQPVFTTLQTSMDELATQLVSVKKLIKSKKVFNEGVQLKRDDCYKRVMQNTVIRKVLYMMKYVVSTPDGVFVTWPFKLKEDRYIFVTNVNVLKFVARHLFPKDVSIAELDNIVSELIQSNIEIYTFEEQDMDVVRTVFPVEPCKKNKVDDKKYKWFGIRAEVLKDLFTALQDQGDVMVASKFAPLLKEWMRQGRDTGMIKTTFKQWTMTPGSRSQMYPTKSAVMIPGKVQWGVNMPLEFFTEDVYKAVQIVGTQKRLGQDQHIGCGWSILYQQPVSVPSYDKFHRSEKKITKPRQAGSKRGPKRVKLNNPDNETTSPSFIQPKSPLLNGIEFENVTGIPGSVDVSGGGGDIDPIQTYFADQVPETPELPASCF